MWRGTRWYFCILRKEPYLDQKEGRGPVASALLHALIHLSAWKKSNSPKFKVASQRDRDRQKRNSGSHLGPGSKFTGRSPHLRRRLVTSGYDLLPTNFERILDSASRRQPHPARVRPHFALLGLLQAEPNLQEQRLLIPPVDVVRVREGRVGVPVAGGHHERSRRLV